MSYDIHFIFCNNDVIVIPKSSHCLYFYWLRYLEIITDTKSIEYRNYLISLYGFYNYKIAFKKYWTTFLKGNEKNICNPESARPNVKVLTEMTESKNKLKHNSIEI